MRAREARCLRERRRHVAPTSDAKFGLEQIVDGLRISLAAGCLHHLADEPADQLGFGARLFNLVGIGGDDVIDHFLDRAQVGDLG